MSTRLRPQLAGALLLLSAGAYAQPTCLYAEDFNGDALPAGWTLSPEVVNDANGGSTAPWSVGTAAEAGANGYFPLPDDPPGNRCALANDDAPPCDCDLADVRLASPVIDLSTVTHAGLRCRVYHDGRPFNTHAWVEASADGAAWDLLREVPAVLGTWQELLLDLDAYAGGTVRLRFRYADGGSWASGMAVDDICVFSRQASDVAIVQAAIGDATASPFLAGDRTLQYTHMPLEQAAELVATVRIRNLGHAPATGLNVSLAVARNGTTLITVNNGAVGALAPLADTLWVVHTGWTPAETGQLDLYCSVTTDPTDASPADNADTTGLMITGAGVVNNQMALDNGIPETFIDNDGTGFSAGCRFELRGGSSQVYGLAVKVGGASQPGALMTALLTDGELNVLAAGTTDTLSAEDLALCFAGGWHYLPFNAPVAVAEDQDALGLVRHDPGNGSLQIAAGGLVTQGSAVQVGTDGLSVGFPLRAPHVRLVLQDPVTGVEPAADLATRPLVMGPNPAQDRVWLEVPGPEGGVVRVLDASGRTWSSGWYRAGQATLELGHLPSGVYVVQFTGGSGVACGRLVMAR